MPKTDVWFDPSRYATVAERIALFYGSHPNGRIQTELINRDASSVTFKALVYRGENDTVPAATGWATEREGDGDINTVACLENTETSAIGRALANLGFTASRERPSVEEMEKAARSRAMRGMAQRSGGAGGMVAEGVAERAGGRAGGQVFLRAHEERPDPTPAAAPAVADLLDLLLEAERAGLPAARTQKLRQRLEHGPAMLPVKLAELERSVRNWLYRRESRVDGEDVTGSRLLP